MLYVGFDGFLSLFVKCVYGLPSVLLMATSVIWEIVVVVVFFFFFFLFCFLGLMEIWILLIFSVGKLGLVSFVFFFFFFFSNQVNPSICFSFLLICSSVFLVLFLVNGA